MGKLIYRGNPRQMESETNSEDFQLSMTTGLLKRAENQVVINSVAIKLNGHKKVLIESPEMVMTPGKSFNMMDNRIYVRNLYATLFELYGVNDATVKSCCGIGINRVNQFIDDLAHTYSN